MAARAAAAVEYVQRYGVAGLDESGLIFEPRALWSVGRWNTAAVSRLDGRKYAFGEVQLPRQDFINGARWPLVITRVSMAAINYLLMSNEPTVAVVPKTKETFRNAASVLASARFMLSVPRRQYYSKRPISSLSLAPRPTGTPSLRGTAQDYASSIFGASRLEFDKPLRMPQQGAIEVALGAPTPYADEDQAETFNAYVHVEELGGGLFPGNSREKNFELGTLIHTHPQLYLPDTFDTSGGTKGAQFPSDQMFSQTEFTKQRPSRSGGSAFSAISVLVDQITSDDGMQMSIVPGIAGSPVCPLSLRTPTRIRTKGGGTGTDWWRPGAPLGLVFTDVTSALVYDLPIPITLNPGDQLSVVLQLPLDVTIDGVHLTPIYQIGFAANGFAVIEG